MVRLVSVRYNIESCTLIRVTEDGNVDWLLVADDDVANDDDVIITEDGNIIADDDTGLTGNAILLADDDDIIARG